jgi:thiosulfate/3-mercaptopyruvate sulfurtransferase
MSLISAADLAADLSTPSPPVILDVRWRLGGPPGREAYLDGHIPGAAFVDLDTALSAPPGPGGRHPLPTAGDFGAAMRAAGVRTLAGHTSTWVVVYDGGDSTAAARAWWCLRYFGHEAVAVLDGGIAAWIAAGFPLATGPGRAPVPGDFVAVPGGLPVLDAAGAADLARSGVLLDARAPERYRGDVEPVDPVGGHIPGAVSAPTFDNVDADGRWRPAADLRERFAALGVVPGGPPVGAYCGSGITAAHEVLALRLAGIDAALYPGSWSEWVADPARPVATGPEPG